jgi:glyoxylase-like metal-dependent hydrolase (beta-lactamase superfamily II)
MTRRLQSILGNFQRLDGGAMFGNAPRTLWREWCPPDDRDRIRLATRALLVREPGRNQLFEAGIGAFFAPALKDRYGVEEEGNQLVAHLEAAGLQEADIHDVVLSHLHFDHAGGILADWQEGAAPRLRFPNARFVVGRRAFDRAREPHLRDRASFVPEMVALLQGLVAEGRLLLVDEGDAGVLGPGFRFHLSDGHTPGMLLTEVETECGPLLFAGDLVPGIPWVNVAITMGYDRFPELLVDEKQHLLGEVAARGGRLFFTHDEHFATARLEATRTGGRLRLSVRDPAETLDEEIGGTPA